jgi:hypothetical protein
MDPLQQKKKEIPFRKCLFVLSFYYLVNLQVFFILLQRFMLLRVLRDRPW